jgi:carbon-monoxide dehydrogenase medium subunit
MILPRFEFESPHSVSDACALLAERGDEARVLAGGTDLLLRMKRGELKPRLLLSLRRTGGLDDIEAMDDGGVRVGVLATMSRIATSPAFAGRYRALAEGAASVAGPLIRNRATVGGNIINARPCADTVPPLMALGARLRLESMWGSRTLDLDGFISGPGETQKRADELLTSIELPALGDGGGNGGGRGGGNGGGRGGGNGGGRGGGNGGGRGDGRDGGRKTGSCYIKVTRRAAMDVTLVGCAAAVTLDASGTNVERARVVLASVAPILLRVPEVESILHGQIPSEAAIREAANASRRACQPVDDHRAPLAYREEIVEVLTQRALQRAVQRARGVAS